MLGRGSNSFGKDLFSKVYPLVFLNLTPVDFLSSRTSIILTRVHAASPVLGNLNQFVFSKVLM